MGQDDLKWLSFFFLEIQNCSSHLKQLDPLPPPFTREGGRDAEKGRDKEHGEEKGERKRSRRERSKPQTVCVCVCPWWKQR